MGILFPSSQSGLLNQSSAQVIDGSLKLNSAKSQVLTRTPAVERNRKTWTFSFWVKLFQNSQTFIGVFGLSGSGGSQTGLDIRFNAAFQLAVSNQVNNSNAWSLVSTAVHRDTGWYHVVIAHDTTQSVEEDRLKMYVNGKQITSFQTSSYPTLNYESSLNKALPHRIGSWDDGGSIYAPMEGMLTNVYMIEGKSLGPGYFGSTDPLTGTWRPRKASADFRILGSGLIYSSYGSGTVSGVKGYTRAFDGNLSLFCEPNDNSTVTFDFTSLPGGGITVGSSLRMYLNKAGSPAAGHFTVNGTNLGGSVPSGGWLTIGSVSRLDTITFYHASGSSSVELYAVEIDGVVLVDGTATKTTVNDGTVWSGGWTGTVMSGYNYTESFDGILGTDANNSTRPDSNQTITWTNPKGSTPFENLRLWCINDGGDAIVRVNGHDVTNQVGDAGYSNAEWYTITNVGKSLSSIQLVAGSSNSPFLWGVEVDGGTMVDSTTQKLDFGPNGFYLPMDGNSSIGEDKSGKGNDWTPVNFSGFTTLDKSTGAFPILNTVSGGNFASSGTRTDANAANLVLALPLVGSTNDVSNRINSGSTTKVMTSNGNAVASSEQSNFYGGSFKFDGTTDFLSTAGSTDYVVNGIDWTVEFFLYADSTSGVNILIENTSNGGGGWSVQLNSGNIQVYLSSGVALLSTAVEANKWYHIALVRSSSTTSLYIDGISRATTSTDAGSTSSDGLTIGARANGDYSLDGYIQDVRLYKGVAKYTSNFVVASSSPDIFPDTPSGVSGGSKLTKITDGAVAFDGASDNLSVPDHADLDFGTDTFTIECFLYMNSYGSSGSYPSFVSKYTNSLSWILRAKNDGKLIWYSSTGGGTNNESSTNPMTLKKWLHIAAVREGTGSNQMKVYVDGKLHLTVTDANDYDDSNVLCIGSQNTGNTNVIDGFVSNVRIVKGTAVYTSEFTPPFRTLTNVTNTKLLCCQSPTSATTATVIPTGSITANGNASATTFNQFNFDTKTVHGNPSNYCTWNPLFIDYGGNNAPCNLSNGNLTAESPNSGDWNIALGTVQVSRGKYYWELIHLQGNVSCMMGIIANTNGGIFNNSSGFYYNPLTWTYYLSTGKKRNGAASGTNYGTAGVNGDVIGVAMDLDQGTISISKNGVSMGVMYDNLPAGEEFTAIWGASKQSTTNQVSANFGQKPFKYAPPEGHGTLSSAGARKDTVIARPDQYFGETIWTGNGGTGLRTIPADFKFKPDFVWEKVRTGTDSHILYDSVRGYGISKALKSNSPVAEGENDNATYGYVNSVFNGGIEIYGGSSAASDSFTNENNQNMVAWCWKAGGGKSGGGGFFKDGVEYASATAAGLDAGSLNPTAASVGTKQGFSIIKADPNQSASTISHGLGKKPAFIISKPIDSGTLDWNVFHQSLGTSEFLRLNTTDGDQNSNHYWGASVTTTTFGVAAGNNGNNQDNPIYYVWADVPGLQKFGSYSSNDSTNGPFIELGFRPALLMVKEYDADGQSWNVFDNKRDSDGNSGNPTFRYLAWNSSSAEGGAGSTAVDFLSNGFKIRNNDNAWNASSSTFIYAAWAESPTVNLYGAQSNAR